MGNFLKRLFGKVEQTGARAADRAHIADASSTVESTAHDRAARGEEPLDSTAGELGGMPNLDGIERAVRALSSEELSHVLETALTTVPADSRSQLGGLVATRAPWALGASSGIVAGAPAELGAALSGILKSGGVGALADLFTATGSPSNAARTLGEDGLSGELFGLATGGGRFDLAAIMQNPLARSVLSTVLPAIGDSAKNSFGG